MLPTYAYLLSGRQEHLEWAAALFRSGSRDPFFKDDPLIYTETKQAVNSLVYGNYFLYAWAGRK